MKYSLVVGKHVVVSGLDDYEEIESPVLPGYEELSAEDKLGNSIVVPLLF